LNDKEKHPTVAPSERRPPLLPDEGFVRLSAIVGPGGPIPISKSTWWAGVKTGRFPAPIKLGRGITVWRVQDIRALIERTG
jgi:prophage regulatory protein